MSDNPLEKPLFDLANYPTTPRAGWDADKIKSIRGLLDAFKDDPVIYQREYRYWRGKWSEEMWWCFDDTPKPCRIVTADPYHEMEQIPLGANAVITHFMPIWMYKSYTVRADRPEGGTISQIGIPRWALIIDGEQNWGDVTG